jgi:hypothetical protein
MTFVIVDSLVLNSAAIDSRQEQPLHESIGSRHEPFLFITNNYFVVSFLAIDFYHPVVIYTAVRRTSLSLPLLPTLFSLSLAIFHCFHRRSIWHLVPFSQTLVA